MKLTQTLNLIKEIGEMEIPVSDTLKGKLVHQTTRNNLTNQLKAALYEDFAEYFLGKENADIIPYLIKEGVIIEIPNESVANSLGPNDLGSGALSIEFSIAIKSLDTDANELADEFNFKKEQKAQKDAQAAKEKAARIEKDKAARELKRKQKAKIQELVDQIGK